MRATQKKPDARTPGRDNTNKLHSIKTERNHNPGNHKIEVDRLLPHDGGAEIQLLESLVAGENQGDPAPLERARTLVEPLDFYRRGGGRVFERMLKFRDTGRPFTLSTLEASFGNDPDAGRFQNLFDALEPVTGQVATHFSKVILENSLRRELIHATHKANGKFFDQAFSVQEILEKLEAVIRETKGRLHHASK